MFISVRLSLPSVPIPSFRQTPGGTISELLNRLKEAIDTDFSSITTRSREFIDNARLNGELGSFKVKRMKLIEDLGSFVYENFKSGLLNEEIAKRCEAIAEVDEKIDGVVDRLKQVSISAQEQAHSHRDEKACQCGTTLRKEQKFCEKCGASVPSNAKSSSLSDEPPLNDCECGYKSRLSDRFCRKCGQKIKSR